MCTHAMHTGLEQYASSDLGRMSSSTGNLHTPFNARYAHVGVQDTGVYVP